MPEKERQAKPPTDDDIFVSSLKRARQGDDQAVGQMLELCRDYLLLIANQDLDTDVRRKMAVSDVVQESMLNAQAHIDRFEGSTRQEFLAWLRGILRNDMLHWRRHYKGVQKRAGEQSVDLAGSQIRRVEPVDDFHTPGTQAVAREEEDMLNRALSELPDNYRQIIRLRSYEDKSFVEIGEQQGCSPDAARKLWSRAIVRMQEIMASQNPGLASRRSES